jgi:hypothetical protein
MSEERDTLTVLGMLKCALFTLLVKVLRPRISTGQALWQTENRTCYNSIIQQEDLLEEVHSEDQNEDV